MHSILRSDPKIFTTLEHKLLQAFIDRDEATIRDLLDERCIGVGVTGTEYTKANFLSQLYQSVRMRSYKIISIDVVEEDHFAVCLINWEVDMDFEGSIIRGRTRVTRTWVRRPSGWKIIGFHVSDVRLATAWEGLKRKT